MSVGISKSPSTLYRRDEVALQSTCIKYANFESIKIRSCHNAGYLCCSENLKLTAQSLRLGRGLGIAALKYTKPGKAPGPDGIHSEFLIHAGNKIVIWLTKFINKLSWLELIPNMWRRASVVAALKPHRLKTHTKLSTHFTALYFIQATGTYSSKRNTPYCVPMSTQWTSWRPSR